MERKYKKEQEINFQNPVTHTVTQGNIADVDYRKIELDGYILLKRTLLVTWDDPNDGKRAGANYTFNIQKICRVEIGSTVSIDNIICEEAITSII